MYSSFITDHDRDKQNFTINKELLKKKKKNYTKKNPFNK